METELTDLQNLLVEKEEKMQEAIKERFSIVDKTHYMEKILKEKEDSIKLALEEHEKALFQNQEAHRKRIDFFKNSIDQN